MSKRKDKVNMKGYEKGYKKQKKSVTLWVKILYCIKKKMYANQIARQLSLSKRKVSYHINNMLDAGLIEEEVYSSCKVYKLTEKGNIYIRDAKGYDFSLPTKKSRLHSLRITFPILKDNPDAVFDKVNKNFKNWMPKYTTVKFPIGITIQKTPSSVVAIFHEFETNRTSCFTDFFSWTMRGSYYVYYFLMNRYEIQIDLMRGEITHQHLANQEPDMKGKIDEKQTTTIDLQRKAKGFMPTTIDGKAWIDFSTGRGIPDIETNDMLYQEKLLLMPENIDRMGKVMLPMMHDLTREVNLHLQLQKETLETMKEIRNFFKSGGKSWKKQKQR